MLTFNHHVIWQSLVAQIAIGSITKLYSASKYSLAEIIQLKFQPTLDVISYHMACAIIVTGHETESFFAKVNLLVKC